MSFLAANSGDAADPVRSAPNDAALIADLKRAVSDLFDAREQCHSLASQLDDLNALFAQCASERNALWAQIHRDADRFRSLRAQLALAHAVLEEARPMLKAHIIAGCACDDGILGRLEAALKGGGERGISPTTGSCSGQ